ncbi:hypothetical protein ACDL92_00390 [Ihubacter sp. mB4P-1]|uniref:cytidylate kinase-like family protein n=1 Tax=Ihubacter sp. mB4P-1 TaxID=3242370 RepID=UPI00137A309A
MESIYRELLKTKKNFVFVGEAGSGKSEIAINFAIGMAGLSEKKIHFFDMDQTKPLFRSRDAKECLMDQGIEFHYQEQFFDAPTTPGGVRELLADENAIVILDVGGDHIGSRLIGVFAPFLNRPNTQNFFVINGYRPWSKNLITIDGTMARVLGMAHIKLENVSIMSNPNVGITTTAEEVLAGHEKVSDMISEYFRIDYLCAMDSLCPEIEGKTDVPLIPVKLYLTYEWNQQ